MCILHFSGNHYSYQLTIVDRLLVFTTMSLYLYVSFKNPGYVTTYIAKDNDFEADIENALKGNKKQNHSELKKTKHKTKKVQLFFITSISRYYQTTSTKSAEKKDQLSI